ncbi:LLM class flavin-dependent oxidoreductase [Nocardia sp. NPDC019395]|uniref:LLM class flavin-dependent oxidoreductase n=1 Tax=Nocardia sp. NPDC019395 TaxID=3154686 RepID=UPI00340CE36E
MVPVVPARPEQAESAARLVAESPGLTRLWQGQSYGVDTATTFAYLAGRGLSTALGTCVMITPLQHPVRAALEARSLAVISGAPVMYCVGPGSMSAQRRLAGAPYGAAVSVTRRYLEDMRSALRSSDPEATRAGEEGSSPLFPVPAPEIRLGAGVLRPAMARTAGQVADVAVTWMCTAEYIRDQLSPAMESAAAAAGRSRPHRVAAVHIAVERPGRDPWVLARVGVGGHLELEHYAATARRCGVAVHPGDSRRTVASAVESGVFVYGSAKAVAQQLRIYAKCGIDEVALNVAAVAACHGTEQALDDVREILGEIYADTGR